VINEEPTTFDQVWNHKVPLRLEKNGGQPVIKSLVMHKKYEWEIIEEEDIPKNRRTFKCKWFFYIKQNGNFGGELLIESFMMNKKDVMEIIKKEDIPKNGRNIKCKWIFKVKQNGVIRARFVCLWI
jgi:hypothetical protein